MKELSSLVAGDRLDLDRLDVKGVDFVALPGYRDYLELRDTLAGRHACDRAITDYLVSTRRPLELQAWCVACRRSSRFVLANPELFASFCDAPNWRETIACRGCGLINRLRASIEMFSSQMNCGLGGPIYLTERVTPLFTWLARNYPEVRGSEFFGDDRRPGELCTIADMSVPHEDVTKLSMDDGSIGHVLSFDVLEHVPGYQEALAEFHRVLAPDGTLLLSVPFDLDSDSTLRCASIKSDGSIEHHEPPEYHGDPVNSGAGVLCFYHFGWDLLDQMRSIGFSEVRLRMYWNPAKAYLGWPGILITGTKA
jgi:SAM-dependent methyltransferase